MAQTLQAAIDNLLTKAVSTNRALFDRGCPPGDKKENNTNNVDNASTTSAAAASAASKLSVGATDVERIAFLRAMCIDFPHARSVWQLLPQDPAQPFNSESEFITVKHCCYILRWWHGAVALRTNIFSATDQFSGIRSEYLSVVQQVIDEFHKLFQTWYLATRLKNTPRQPRVLRLADKLGLTFHETEAVIFVLLQHCSAQKLPVSHDRDFSCTLHSTQRMAGMSPRELLHFLGPSRLHVKQGVIIVPERMAPADIAYLQMPQVIVAALSGAVPLSQEEAVKLEKTTLCDLLMDDGGCLPAGLQMERMDSTIATKAAAEAVGADASARSSGAKGKFPQRRQRGSKTTSGRGSGSNFDEDEEGSSNSDGSDSSSDNGTDADGTSTAASPTMDPQPSSGKLKPVDLKQSLDSSSGGGGAAAAAAAAPSSSNNNNNNNNNNNEQEEAVQPYKEGDDLVYLEDQFQHIACLIKMRNTESDSKDEETLYSPAPKNKADAQLREFKGKERLQRAKVQGRVDATRKAAAAAAAASAGGGDKDKSSGWLPRVEVLSDKLGLNQFEKLALLLVAGNVVSHDVQVAINGRYVMRDGASMGMTVGYLLFVLTEGLDKRISARRCFTKAAPLVRDGIITVSPPDGKTSFNTDLVEHTVDVDRKIVDAIIGNDISPAELVQNSKLFEPRVSLDDVVLAAASRRTIAACIDSYHNFAKLMQSHEAFQDGPLMQNPSGLCVLLAGPSGCGKTLCAQAIAKTLGQKILVVNAMTVKNATNPGEMIRFLMRESRLHNATVFFDECESLFESRVTNPMLTAVLAEFELFTGVVILATNRHHNFDEAMNRRISVIVEFGLPDNLMRQSIWEKHLPPKAVLPLAADVDIEAVAMDFCLSGGLIRNAVLAALRNAVQREGTDRPKALTRADIEDGARSQLRGLFQVSEITTGAQQQQQTSNRIQTPARSLSDVVLDSATRERIGQLVRKIKSRNLLFSQWGFRETEVEAEGSIVALITARSGNGKSLVAEALARECGLNIRVANLAAMMLKGEKDIVAELQTIFDEASALGLMIVFDGAEELFSASSSLSEVAAHTASLLQYQANGRFRKPIVFLASTGGGSGIGAGGSSSRNDVTLDLSTCAVRFTDVVQLNLPNATLRAHMFRSFIPSAVPVADGLDFTKMAEPTLTPKAIRTICFNACSMAAMTQHGSGAEQPKLTMELLQKATRDFQEAEQKRRPHSSMFM